MVKYHSNCINIIKEIVMGTTVVYNVKDYRIPSDPVGDDTPSIQRAINAAIQSPFPHVGTVYFPSGVYGIYSTIVIDTSNGAVIEIVGNGRSSQLRQYFDGNLFTWNGSCRRQTIRDLKISPFVPQTLTTLSSYVFFCQFGAEKSIFENILIENEAGFNPVNGIFMANPADSTTILNCFFLNMTGVGIRIDEGSEVRVIGGRIGGATGGTHVNDINNRGIFVTGNNGGVHITDTDLINLYQGLRIENATGAGNNREIFVTHATFDSCYQGLALLDSCYVSVAGCWAASCSSDNIYVGTNLTGGATNGPLLVVDGGSIFNAGANGIADPNNGANGITINSGSFVLTGIAIRNNQGRGVWVPSNNNVRKYSITGCRITDNTNRGVDLVGNGYICTNNLFSGNGSSNFFGGANSLTSPNLNI